MLNGLVRAFDRLLEICAMALLTALLGMVSAGIISRALNQPLGFTDEASGYLMVWLACFGWMLATRRGQHIRIRFFIDRFPGAARPAAELVMHVAAIFTGAVIAWTVLGVIKANSDVEATTMPVAASWLYIPLVPAGLVTMAQGVADLIAGVRRGGAGKPA